MGKILGYDNDHLKMPNKIIEMGLLPETVFRICIRLRSVGRCMWNLGQRKAGLLFVKKEIISLLKN
jgi:ferrous iron transport protein A